MARINRTGAHVALAVALLLAGGSAMASDQGITGKKLLLKSSAKFVLLSKDGGISIAGSDPVGVPTRRSPSTTAAAQ